MQRNKVKVNSRNIKTILDQLIQRGQELGIYDQNGNLNIQTTSLTEVDALTKDLSEEELQSIEALIALDFSELMAEVKAESAKVADLADQDPAIQGIFATHYPFSPRFISPKGHKSYRDYYSGDFEAIQQQRAAWGFREIMSHTESLDIQNTHTAYNPLLHSDPSFFGAEREQAEEDAINNFKVRMKAKSHHTVAEKLVSSTVTVRADMQTVVNSHDALQRKIKTQPAIGSIYDEFVSGLKQLNTSLPKAKAQRESFPSARRWEQTKGFGQYLWQKAKENKKKILFWMGVGAVLTVASVLTFGAAAGVVGAGFAAWGAGSVAAGAVTSTIWGATGGAAIAYGAWNVGKNIKEAIDTRRQDATYARLDNMLTQAREPLLDPVADSTSTAVVPAPKPEAMIARDDQGTVYQPLHSPKRQSVAAKPEQSTQRSVFGLCPLKRSRG